MVERESARAKPGPPLNQKGKLWIGAQWLSMVQKPEDRGEQEGHS